MPVRVVPFTHPARLVSPSINFITNDDREILYRACNQRPKEVFSSSFDAGQSSSSVVPERNGFVESVISAYNTHHHLHLRPEDVWFAILSQFSNYVNAHAEELRSMFVAHAGQQHLEIVFPIRSRYDHHIHVAFAKQMSKEIQKHVVDPGLREWILPSFTTTTSQDEVVASVLMMGTMKQ